MPLLYIILWYMYDDEFCMQHLSLLLKGIWRGAWKEILYPAIEVCLLSHNHFCFLSMIFYPRKSTRLYLRLGVKISNTLIFDFQIFVTLEPLLLTAEE